MLRSIVGVLAVAAAGTFYVSTMACSSSSAGGAPDTSDSGSGGGSGSSSGGTASCDIGGGAGVSCQTAAVTAFVPCLTGSALLSPSVSYTTDVQPIFNTCGSAGGTCHGDPNSDAGVTGLIFLGKPAGGVPASAVLPNIVGQASPEDPKMEIIKAGDPGNSYLMHKLDGDECVYSADCSGAVNVAFIDCGAQMPDLGPYLSQAQRDVIRSWIAQGALAN
jgi:hypothetical protein